MDIRPYQAKLIEKTKQSLLNGHRHVLVQSPAGSGKTITMAEIAKSATDKGNRVLFVVHRQEIIQQVTRTFDNWGVNMSLCDIGMIQTVTRRIAKMKTPQLILCDEAHHSLATSYKRVFRHFDNATLVGFTATPVRLSGKGLGDVYDDLIIGPQIDWLINNHFLAPFDYYAPTLIDVEKLKRTSTGDYSNKSMDDAVKIRAVFGDVLKTYRTVADGTKTIVYAHNVQASIDIAKAFNCAGYHAQQVDGKTPAEKRTEAMVNFRSGKTQILVNAELYGEGVDVPDCQTVIMLRPTDSLTLFIQQSMRGMRYRPNKRAIIIDHVANVYRFGLPDADREWSLEDRPKQKKHRGKSDGPAIKSCPKCYGIVPAQVKQCPLCGYSFRADGTDLEVDPTAKLKKVDKKVFKIVADYSKTKYGQMKAEDAESPEDMYAIAKAHGYKPGWAYHQIVARGWLKERKRA
ncbi:type I restriction enzyme EcoKI subunit R [Lacticaseibacillus paracasei]|uniref:DEAD/DEAH box helicase n=1 Tax=Lacticaseibacillus paracasei TaxID=1597 RepID=UPI000FF71BE9|nr:DEAD/DEAH box helicase [Lacticaseibacillus paracasei]RND95691.1 type I restriction enzyme EcoKI subunit R [Lacticaseibacillus paracasei]